MEPAAIAAYLDPLSAAPGDVVSVRVSTTLPAYEARLVRLISGDSRPHGTGYADVQVEAGVPRHHTGREQAIIPGSWATLAGLPALGAPGLSMHFMPTLPGEPQTLLAAPGLILTIHDGRLTVTSGEAVVTPAMQLRAWRWHTLFLTTAAGRLAVALHVRGEGVAESSRTAVSLPTGGAVGTRAGDWWLAAASPPGGCFNGRIEHPVISDGACLHALMTDHASVNTIAEWDFSDQMASDVIPDRRQGRSATLHQQPARAVTGHRWDGSVHAWTLDPAHYAAVHFHDDDLIDALWEADFEWRVPDDLPSGVYALHLSAGDEEDNLPLFVRPGPGRRRADMALLISTATYLAYANQRVADVSHFDGRPYRSRNPWDAWLYAHPEVGLSLYEYHRDGSGVHYSSRHRPIMNLRPKTLTWSFNADTNITAWLEAEREGFDVITDEDLHAEGAAVLRDYRVVITCTHPEYHSTQMLDALTAWMGGGGRLMYMGGNGFYWRVAFHPTRPGIMEVRRAEDGTRAWIARPGEYHHQFTGEYGGLWRRLGRPPNSLVGVGFAAQGFDGGTYYRLTPAAADPRVAFIMDGTTGREIIGDHGTQAGGAAGEEIDRWDTTLGSPAHALVIAASEQHRPGMLRTIEEVHMTAEPGADPDVRADLTFFETPSGGAVFSTGSISWAGALSHNFYDNDVRRMTGNVLRRFMDPAPFTFPGGDPPDGSGGGSGPEGRQR